MKQQENGLCAFDGCARDARAKGYCRAHYMQLWTRGDVSLLTPIQEKPAKASRVCGWCGAEIVRAPSQLRSAFVYCNLEHKGLHKRRLSDLHRGTCKVEGCSEPAKYVKSGLCRFHYGRKTQGRSVAGPRAWMPPVSCSCTWCGKTFKRRHSQASASEHAFCSQWCYHEWLTDGSKARYVDAHGYAWLRISRMDEPRRAFARECSRGRAVIAEHRLVMAEALGRPLDKSEQVHHVNGVKDDNRIDNLEVQGSGDHQKYHADVYAEVRALRLENERLKELVTA